MKKFNILAIIMLILSSAACKTEIEQLTLWPSQIKYVHPR